MNKIRILHTVDRFGYGGMERGILKLLNGLDRSRFEPHLVVMRDIDPDVTSHIAPDVRTFEFQKTEGRNLGLIRQLADYMKTQDIHVVHSHNWGTWFYSQMAAFLAGAPVFIHGEHGRDTEALQDGPLKRMFKTMLSYFCRQFTTVSYDISELIQQEWRVPSKKITVIENGIDVERFKPADQSEAKSKLNLPPDRCVLGTVIGSFRPVKDLPTLFRALAMLNNTSQNWHLAIVGGRVDNIADVYLNSLKKLTNELGLTDQITFFGPQHAVERYMQAFDIYVNSSVYEGMSNTILEAMGCGAAIVATKVGGTPRIVQHGHTGLLVPHKSPQDLAAALGWMVENPIYRTKLAQKAREYVSAQHSLSAFVQQHQELYAKWMAAKQQNVVPGFSNTTLTLEHNQAETI